MFRSILCATDFSPGGNHAVEVAAKWAEATNASLDVLHVVTPIVTLVPETSFLAELRAMIRGDAAGKLDALVESLKPRVKASARLVDGFADQQIVSQTQALGSDLVVVGTAGTRSFSRMLLGSTADRVVQTCNVPVLAVPQESTTVLPAAIVVPTDLGGASGRAFALATELGKRFGASVSVVLGYELGVFADRDALRNRDLPRMLTEKVRSSLGLDSTTNLHIVESEASAAIARLVESTNANLIVMAGGGRSKTSSLLLGSVTERVLRKSRIPVLVLREHAPR